METRIRAAALLIVSATLGACGGGGGGGGVNPGPSTTEVPLASFAAVAPNQTVVMEGTSATLSGTATTSGDTLTVTSADAGPIGNATVKFSYDEARKLSAITVNTPQASFSFERNTPGHSVSCSGNGSCRAESPSADVLAVDPSVTGWNYQTFGVWGMESGPNSFKLGAVSAGTPTSGNALTTTGAATFTGIAAGFYVDSGGSVHATGASMKAEVNFGTRNIGFSTSSTTRSGTADSGLNLSGTLSYAQGANAFSGSLQTQNGQLSGQGAGRFFGPGAEEIGGVYSLQGGGVSRMGGGFGGKR
jgi:hypothetical protein